MTSGICRRCVPTILFSTVGASSYPRAASPIHFFIPPLLFKAGLSFDLRKTTFPVSAGRDAFGTVRFLFVGRATVAVRPRFGGRAAIEARAHGHRSAANETKAHRNNSTFYDDNNPAERNRGDWRKTDNRTPFAA